MANFVTETSYPYLGDAQIIESVECIMDKPRSFGSAVKLVDDGIKQSYAFSFKAADVSAQNDFGGILVNGVNYDESGKAITGKTSTVITKGRVVIPLDQITSKTFGSKVYVTSAGKYTHDASTNAPVGTICSKVFKAQSIENDKLVDAVYVSVGE